MRKKFAAFSPTIFALTMFASMIDGLGDEPVGATTTIENVEEPNLENEPMDAIEAIEAEYVPEPSPEIEPAA